MRAPGSQRWTDWRTYLIRVARGRFHLSAQDADEVVQEALIGVSSHLDDIRDPAALLGYMLMALRNEVVQHRRKIARQPGTASIDESPVQGTRPLSESIADEGPSPESQMYLRERRLLLVRELERICAARRHSERDLRIAIQVFVEDCKSGQVAREMGLSPQTVYNVTHRILEALEQTSWGEVA